jgi:hypothetical protein
MGLTPERKTELRRIYGELYLPDVEQTTRYLAGPSGDEEHAFLRQIANGEVPRCTPVPLSWMAM